MSIPFDLSDQFKIAVVDGDLKLLPHHADAGSSCFDLRARVNHSVHLKPGERVLVHTGIHTALPTGYEIQIRPRSGLAYKNGVTVLNAPGTIDASYRGEIGVILINHSAETFTINRYDRIAQATVCKVQHTAWVQVAVEELPSSDRGTGGFGSTGVK